MRRRALLANSQVSGGGDVTFPATLVPCPVWEGEENTSNAAIANYFLNTYPDMVVGFRGGRYTPIIEDVVIKGSIYCNGKVLGVAKWSDDPTNLAIQFFTQQGLDDVHAFRVAITFGNDPQGSTAEYFFD